MAGHNKWSKIKNKKGKEDAKRGKEFTKMGRAITLAARQGGDNPEYNAALKTAIEKAKEINMPNDNINRAIKRGSSELDGDNFEEITYEGYGPSGVAVIVECLTDNRNRTAAEIRHAFDKYGGNLATTGSVSFLFSYLGVILIDQEKYDVDNLFMEAMELDIEDIGNEDGVVEIYTSVSNYNQVKEALAHLDYDFLESDLMYVPSNFIDIDDQEARDNMSKMIDILEENDDVQNVYHNWSFVDEE